VHCVRSGLAVAVKSTTWPLPSGTKTALASNSVDTWLTVLSSIGDRLYDVPLGGSHARTIVSNS